MGGAAGVARELHLRLRQLPDVTSTLITAEPVSGDIPARLRERFLGHQYVYYPDSYRLSDLLAVPPDIYHLHNLHGWYFDLAAIPHLARHAPIVMTLHDEWMLTGHCGCTLDCDRWKTGCGQCPDLERYPIIPVDGTAFNWQRKRRTLTPDLPIYITAPSDWLLDRARSTYLGQYPMRMIPNGVDVERFCPGDRLASHRALDLPEDRPIILFSAGRPDDPYKDFPTLMDAFRSLMEQLPDSARPYLVALGGDVPQELPNLLTPGYISDERMMVDYYRSATLVVHASRADSFGLAAAEALACGVPVIASKVGGLLETLGEAGLLVEVANSRALADAILTLLNDEARREQMGQAGRQRVVSRFDIRRQVTDTYNWYQEILHGQ
jgi:glycosyltransferase involved in cell wall biosynthesis